MRYDEGGGGRVVGPRGIAGLGASGGPAVHHEVETTLDLAIRHLGATGRVERDHRRTTMTRGDRGNARPEGGEQADHEEPRGHRLAGDDA